MSPDAFEQNGTLIGIAWDTDGGQYGIDSFGAAGPVPGYRQIDGLYSFYGNLPVYKWLQANMDGALTTMSCNVYAIQKSPSPIYASTDMLPIEVKFPACNVDSKDSAGITMRVKSKTFQKMNDQQLASRTVVDAAKKQKVWLCSNFKVSLGDLPTSRATKTDPFVVHMSIGDLNGDGKLDIVNSPDDFTFYVQVADAPAFVDAFNSSLAGTPKDYPLELDYLDGDGNMLIGVYTTVNVVSVGAGDMFMDPTDPSATAAVTVRAKVIAHIKTGDIYIS